MTSIDSSLPEELEAMLVEGLRSGDSIQWTPISGRASSRKR